MRLRALQDASRFYYEDDVTIQVLDLVKLQDPRHPVHWPTWKRWLIIVVYCLLQAFITLTQTSYIGAEAHIKARYGGSTQEITLGQSLFIVGNAVGPAFMGPFSDVGGRKWMYVVSIAFYAAFNVVINLPMLVTFMFLSGVAGSTAVTNVASTIADLFGNVDGAGQAMGLFVVSANIGPALGSPVGGWIADNTYMGLRWFFLTNVFIGLTFSSIMATMPETLPRLVIAKAAEKANPGSEFASILRSKVNVPTEIKFVTTMTFRLMFTEPIILFMALSNGFCFGLMFLYLDGVFDIFVVNNGLSIISADLTYLNFAAGVILMFAFMPVQTYFYSRDRIEHEHGRPEARFLVSLVTVWLFPISLLTFAFTSDGKTNYWIPIVAGGALGFANPIVWLSMLTYVTDSYPNIAASAIAAFMVPTFMVAAALAHVGPFMFEHMSTTWAMATLGFLSLGVCVLVYVIYFEGEYLRRRSMRAHSDD
ncbi:hypothetical protein B7494_g4940 [Chlorociboria aeruginascens]|nr:hypothetical protein B7494_g4940 [Chlorociboria aeruginascens]